MTMKVAYENNYFQIDGGFTINKGQKYNMVDQNFCIVPVAIMLLHNFNNIICIINLFDIFNFTLP